jgi:hypothetical protein
MTFSRPKAQSLIDLPKLRFGFWIESGTKSEAQTCGWGYRPLIDLQFQCFSYQSDKNISQIKKRPFSEFSSIHSSSHYNFLWNKIDQDVPIFNGIDYKSQIVNEWG